MKNIDKHVHQLIEWIEQTYEVDANEISAKWKEISGSGAGKTGKAQHVNSGLDPTLCQHTFRVGNNAGMQCGVKPKDGPLCSSHKPKSRASSNEKTVDIVDGALNPIYCNFEVGERKQCGVKPKTGGLCSIHRNGAPKIKTVPLVDGVMDPMFCNRKLSETTQCGVKPKAGNYCSSHREPIPKTPSSSKSEKTSRKLKSETESSSETESDETYESRRVTRSQARKLKSHVTRSQARKLKKSDSDSQAKGSEESSDETDSESRRVTTRSQARKKNSAEESSDEESRRVQARKLKKSEESEISESEDELLEDAIKRGKSYNKWKKKKIKEDKWVTQFNGLKTIKLAQKGRAWSKSNKLPI